MQEIKSNIYIYHKIILCITTSTQNSNEKPSIPYFHKRDVLWKLGIIFETLILHPIPRKSTEGTATHINNRLHLLQIGDIETVYNMAYNVKSLTPLQKKDLSQNTPKQQIQKNAQMAADLDNYRSALDRLSQNTPIAINTEDNVNRLKKLYPEKHNITQCITINNTTHPQNTQQETSIETSPRSSCASPRAKQQALSQTFQTLYDH